MENIKYYAAASEGLWYVHHGEYMKALATFDNLVIQYPEDPAGYYFKASVYQTVMRDYRTNQFSAEFDSLIVRTIETGKNTKSADSHCYLYLGGAYMYRSIQKMGKRDWYGAFSDGRKGIHLLKTAVVKNPDLYDSYLGLGLYHYWRSVKLKKLKIAFFMKDNRQKGIDEIQYTVANGKFMTIGAKYALVEIYFNEKEYRKALTINQELYNNYPVNPSCLYMRSRIFEKMGDWENARIATLELLRHLEESEYSSVGYKIECKYHLAYGYYKTCELDYALKEITNATELISNRNASKEIEGTYEDFEDIVNNIEWLLNELTVNRDVKKHQVSIN